MRAERWKTGIKKISGFPDIFLMNSYVNILVAWLRFCFLLLIRGHDQQVDIFLHQEVDRVSEAQLEARW